MFEFLICLIIVLVVFYFFLNNNEKFTTGTNIMECGSSFNRAVTPGVCPDKCPYRNCSDDNYCTCDATENKYALINKDLKDHNMMKFNRELFEDNIEVDSVCDQYFKGSDKDKVKCPKECPIWTQVGEDNEWQCIPQRR